MRAAGRATPVAIAAVVLVALSGCAAFRGPCSQSQSIVMVDGIPHVWTLGCGRNDTRVARPDEISSLPMSDL